MSSRGRAARRLMWGTLAATALLWPARMSGPFDGVPLDGAAEAVLLGVVLPALWWFNPRFLTTRLARACVIALLAWKALTAIAFAQDGWCVRVMPAQPFAKDATGAPHGWDIRADWRSANPSCSAIMTRPYTQFSEFPVWFFNLPPQSGDWPGPRDRPPGATVAMTVNGFLRARRPGVLRIVMGPDMTAAVHVDGAIVSRTDATRDGVTLTPGSHEITVDASLTGERWQFVPLWNGADLWSTSMATVRKPSSVDAAIRPWGKWVVGLLVAVFGLAWLASAAVRIRDAGVLTWTIGTSACIGLLPAIAHGDLVRWSTVGLAGAAIVPVPARLRNVRGAFILIGVPWLTLIVVRNAAAIGRFTLYTAGDDYWIFQRFAYRIFMQGYWLEGGERTFWFQPFYRWIAGALHLIFGDSSVGEAYWDGASVLVAALFSFQIVRSVSGFRWGLGAAVMTLAVFTLGTTWWVIGRGLSEISSAGLVYLGAILALRSRNGNWGKAIAAGVLAGLAFYTRLNNLPMALALVVFALPVGQPIRTAWTPTAWLPCVAWRTVAGVIVPLAVSLLLFAWRTWYYTGVFSVFHGTQRELLAVWQSGMSPATLLVRMAGSVMMVLTMNDPARFDPRALPLLAAALVSVLAVLGVPRLRDLPLGPVLFCLAAIFGSLVSRGSSYPGRFSIHVIAVASTVVMCTIALLCKAPFTRSTASSS